MRQHCGKAAAISEHIWAFDESQRDVQREYMSPRFVWIEKRWLDERITARVGQFAGQDFYEPSNTAVFHLRVHGLCVGQSIYDLRVLRPALDAAMKSRRAIHNVYVKSMVLPRFAPLFHKPNRVRRSSTNSVSVRDWFSLRARRPRRASL